MKTWQKIIVCVVSGGLIYGLGFCGTVWTNLAHAFNLFAAGVGMLCGALTGFTATK